MSAIRKNQSQVFVVLLVSFVSIIYTSNSVCAYSINWGTGQGSVILHSMDRGSWQKIHVMEKGGPISETYVEAKAELNINSHMMKTYSRAGKHPGNIGGTETAIAWTHIYHPFTITDGYAPVKTFLDTSGGGNLYGITGAHGDPRGFYSLLYSRAWVDGTTLDNTNWSEMGNKTTESLHDETVGILDDIISIYTGGTSVNDLDFMNSVKSFVEGVSNVRDVLSEDKESGPTPITFKGRTIDNLQTDTQYIFQMDLISISDKLNYGYCYSDSFHTFNAQLSVIPEPTTLLLFGSGLVAMIGFRKKKSLSKKG